MEITPIAYIENDYTDKFGIPRQSGLANSIISKIIFYPEYRQTEAFDGIAEFSYLWLIWDFHMSHREHWSATVKPPKLDPSDKKGIFATRSPFRPNPLGLSSVELIKFENDTELGPVLYVRGADLMNHTPIYDIKPYLSYCDAHSNIKSGFADQVKDYQLEVSFETQVAEQLDEEQKEQIIDVLKEDPRPRYLKNKRDTFHIILGTKDIHFKVNDLDKSIYVFNITQI